MFGCLCDKISLRLNCVYILLAGIDHFSRKCVNCKMTRTFSIAVCQHLPEVKDYISIQIRVKTFKLYNFIKWNTDLTNKPSEKYDYVFIFYSSFLDKSRLTTIENYRIILLFSSLNKILTAKWNKELPIFRSFWLFFVVSLSVLVLSLCLVVEVKRIRQTYICEVLEYSIFIIRTRHVGCGQPHEIAYAASQFLFSFEIRDGFDALSLLRPAVPIH